MFYRVRKDKSGWEPRRLFAVVEFMMHGSMVEVTPWQCPSSAPVPPHGAPGGSRRLGTPRKRPAHWALSHCLRCSSWSPPKAAHFTAVDHSGAGIFGAGYSSGVQVSSEDPE